MKIFNEIFQNRLEISLDLDDPEPKTLNTKTLAFRREFTRNPRIFFPTEPRKLGSSTIPNPCSRFFHAQSTPDRNSDREHLEGGGIASAVGG